MISKLLANKLKCCLDKCISHEEYAFVEAIEVIHASKRVEWRCKGGVAYLAETGLFGGNNSQSKILSSHIFFLEADISHSPSYA